MAVQIGSHVLAGVQEALRSGAYTDLTITCGEDKYEVHRVVVCPSVAFFLKAVVFPGKRPLKLLMKPVHLAQQSQEASAGVIDLAEDEPPIIKLLIQYLYEGDYDPKASTKSRGEIMRQYVASRTQAPPAPSATPTENSTMRLPHTCVPSISNRGNVKEKCNNVQACLHHVCGVQCSMNCREFICPTYFASAETYDNNQAMKGPHALLLNAKMYEIGEKYGVYGLKNLAQRKFIVACNLYWNDEAFPAAAHYVYSSTVESDQGLRSVVHKTICKHITLIKKAEIASMMDEFNLAMAILMDKMKENYGR